MIEQVGSVVSGWTLLLVLILASVMWPRLRGAPWVPSRLATVREMLFVAGVQPGELIYDLGCGDGRVLVLAAREFDARAVGIEIDPLRYLWSQLLIAVLGLRGQVRIVYGDFFLQDLGEADVVTCYLMQNTNERLTGKLRRELRAGARVVSNSFTFPGLTLTAKGVQADVYVYRLGRQSCLLRDVAG